MPLVFLLRVAALLSIIYRGCLWDEASLLRQKGSQIVMRLKRRKMILLFAVLVLALVGCAERRGAPGEDGANRVVLGIGKGEGDSTLYVDSDEPSPTPTPTPTATPTPTPKPEVTPGDVTPGLHPTDDPGPDTPPADGSFSAADCAYVVNGVTVKPNMDFTGMAESVGKVKERLEGVACMDDGNDVNYYYDGLVVNTLSKNSREMVYLVSVSGDVGETPRGIKVGSTAGEILETYGDPAEDDGSIITYSDGTIQMLFYLDDDVVTEIALLDASYN